MNTALALGLVLTLLASLVCLALLLWKRKPPIDLSPLETRLAGLAEGQERSERALREEMATNRKENSSAAQQGREELAGAIKDMREEANANRKNHREEIATSLKNFNDSVLKGVADLTTLQKGELGKVIEELRNLTTSNESKLETLRGLVDDRLKEIRENNEKQLDQMRATVDEKLQGTLEKRIGESFKLVSDQLRQVHEGLGDMQNLATGVGDLKRLFGNVRARGAWGEVQLEALLADMLTADQYEKNVETKKDSGKRIEYAIKFPGDSDGRPVFLPIDSKFPLEVYQRLVEAQEKADLAAIELAGNQLEAQVRACAKDINEKYLDPPQTTDLALMFLPSEALYAEVARRAGLPEVVRREFRVNICGPSTLAVTLNAFRMGFRTLAIQKRSSEVWKLLGVVRTQFGKFGDLLDKLRKRLLQATDTVEDAARKSRTIERKLHDVEVLPEPEIQALLAAGEGEEEVNETDVVENAIEDEPDVPF